MGVTDAVYRMRAMCACYAILTHFATPLAVSGIMMRKMITKRVRTLASALLTIVGTAALLAPLMGAALDHHFAERQPGHLHIGAPREHTHAHAFEHAHHLHHAHAANRYARAASDGADTPIALYKSEGSAAATLAVSPSNLDDEALRQFRPTSVFTLPSLSDSAMRQRALPPPDKPPEHTL